MPPLILVQKGAADVNFVVSGRGGVDGERRSWRCGARQHAS